MSEFKSEFKNELAKFVYMRTYSRYLPKEGRRENWEETVTRVVDYYRKIAGDKLPKKNFEDIYNAILNFEVMPSMRLMWSAGKSLDACGFASYNCSAVTCNSLRVFGEAMFILMNGCGLGFSVEQKYVDKLPAVKEETGKNKTTVVEDSKEGWGRALDEVVRNLWDGHDITLDTSKVRPLGAPLKTSGGRASGDGALVSCVEMFKRVITKHRGRRLSALNIHDLMCKIAEIVIVGGQRRSALISLSDLHHEGMKGAKKGQFWIDHPERSLSNNSATYWHKPSSAVFMKEWLALVESKTGERGIMNFSNLKNIIPKRRDHTKIVATNPCITGDTYVCVADGRGKVKMRDLAEQGFDVTVFCRNSQGDLTVGIMRNPRLTNHSEEIFELTLETGESIRVTGNHKFLTGELKYVEVSNLEIADALSLTRESSIDKRMVEDPKRGNTSMLSVNIGGEFRVRKFCEECLRTLTPKFENREICFCSETCSKKYLTKLRLDLRRDRTLSYRIKSIEKVGDEEVYNGTVDYFHNYLVGGWGDGIRQQWLETTNCGEIFLRGSNEEEGKPDGGGGLCNLSSVVIRKEDTMDTLLEKIKLATIIGTIQSTITNFGNFVSPLWKQNCEDERLLGVSMSGQMDNPKILTPKNLQELKDYSIGVNTRVSRKLGINRSTSITCVKPEGTSSQLVDSSSGFHPRFAPYYLRRVRIATSDPLYKMMVNQGVEFEPEVGQVRETMTVAVCQFPVASPKGAITVEDVNAIEQLEQWLKIKENYTEHTVSATIYVNEDEWFKVGNWVFEHFDRISGVSFLPKSDHVYELAPYHEITKEEYKKYKKEEVIIDYSKLPDFEKEDEGNGAKAMSCEGDKCELTRKD